MLDTDLNLFPSGNKTSWRLFVRPSDVAGTSQMKHPTMSQWNVAKTSQRYVFTNSYWYAVTTSQEDVMAMPINMSPQSLK